MSLHNLCPDMRCIKCGDIVTDVKPIAGAPYICEACSMANDQADSESG